MDQLLDAIAHIDRYLNSGVAPADERADLRISRRILVEIVARMSGRPVEATA